MKCKPLGVIFALCTLLGPVFMMSALQTKTAVTALADAFGTSELIWAVIMVVLVAAVVCGGLTRVGKVAEFVAPIQCYCNHVPVRFYQKFCLWRYFRFHGQMGR